MIKFLVGMLVVVAMSWTVAAESDVSELQTMEFIDIGWAYEVRGYGDYDRNEDESFARGERAYAYMEVQGYSVKPQDGLHLVDVAVDVSLKSTWGIPLFSQQDLVNHQALESAPPDSLWFYIWVDIPRWAPRARYLAEVTLRDRISGLEISEARDIFVR